MAEPPHRPDIETIYVVAEWSSDDERKQYLPVAATQHKLKFQLAFDNSNNSSFCKLHFPFAARAFTISLLIPPERIAALDPEHQRPGDTLPGEFSKQIGPKAYRLRFTMKSPPSLVTPQVPPQNNAYADYLSIVHSLVRMPTFTLYLNRLGRLAVDERLRPLCDAIYRCSVLSMPNQ